MATGGLSTSMEVVGEAAYFNVYTSRPLYQERLVHLGFRRASPESFTRRFSATQGIESIHANFSRHLEQMLLQSARLAPIRWADALREFLRRVEGSGMRWWLSGSAALAVRNIDVDPGDLDFVVDDPHVVGDLLQDLLVEPVTKMSDWIATWFGRAFFGATIEWVSDVDPDIDDYGPHEQGPAAARGLETVTWEGHTISVTPLDLQLAVAERRGQQERVAKIRSALGR